MWVRRRANISRHETVHTVLGIRFDFSAPSRTLRAENGLSLLARLRRSAADPCWQAHTHFLIAESEFLYAIWNPAVAPIGAAVLTTLEVRQASASTMQPYYDPYFVAVLWEGRTRCDSLWRSLKGDVVAILPTVQGATPYDRLYWTGYALGSAPVNVAMRVWARAVDHNGVPLGNGWRAIGQATIQTPPLRWFRVEIPEGHWDEYRIEVRSATTRLVYSRVIASQGYWKE